MQRLLGLLFLVTSCCVAFAPMVGADRGVGVDVGQLAVGRTLEPGQSYDLPRIGVTNTGDETTEYGLSVGHLDGQSARLPDPDWISFAPQRFVLEPGQTRDVSIEIVLPANAEPGDYFALLRAQTAPPESGGASLGVAAATKLSFTVEPASWFEAQRHRINRWLDDYAPWTYILPAGLLLVVLATKVSKVPFRIRVERK